MGKRSNFKRIERDYYPTPYEAVKPLLPYLGFGTLFSEPCAGDGRLIDHLKKHGHRCYLATDIEPRRDDIGKSDIFDIPDFYFGECIITNPPWDRKVLHPIIKHLTANSPKSWLLFDADWMHTKQSTEYMKYCSKIISVGRVKWIENSKHTGKDNCAWYCFEDTEVARTEFIGR